MYIMWHFKMTMMCLIAFTTIFTACDTTTDTRYSENATQARKHYLIARNETQSGEFHSALDNINRALELQQNYYYYYLRQKIHNNMESWVNCAEDGDKLIQLEPGYFESYLLTAECNYQLGQYKKAITSYDWFILRNDISKPDFFFKRGNSYLEIGKPKKAALDWNKACYLDNTYCSNFPKLIN